MTKYQEAQQELRFKARWAKKQYGDDRPAIRGVINDATSDLIREYNFDKRHELWLQNYAVKLHPKK